MSFILQMNFLIKKNKATEVNLSLLFPNAYPHSSPSLFLFPREIFPSFPFPEATGIINCVFFQYILIFLLHIGIYKQHIVSFYAYWNCTITSILQSPFVRPALFLKSVHVDTYGSNLFIFSAMWVPPYSFIQQIFMCINNVPRNVLVAGSTAMKETKYEHSLIYFLLSIKRH